MRMRRAGRTIAPSAVGALVAVTEVRGAVDAFAAVLEAFDEVPVCDEIVTVF
ncbi:MAG TPA: hypothetical protein VF152_04155 [Acidimicrobiia bacterium]